MKANAKGFTLIELLVVITIIGILSAGAIGFFSASQQKARDSVRVSDLNVYKNAVVQMYDDNGGEYPASGTTFGPAAVKGNYLEKVLRVLAPLLPFATEKIFRDLNGKEKSVHLERKHHQK